MSEPRVLILGGTGFLGKALLDSLRKKKVAVGATYLSHPPSSTEEAIPLDILDGPAVEKAIAGWDIVVNCTGQVTRPIELCLRTNSLGALNVARAMRKSGARLVQLSTMAVYGTAARVTEESSVRPETPYGTAKATAELLLRETLDPKQIAVCRLSNLYGPNQKVGILAYLQRSFASDRRLTFNNDGSLRRFYVHVEDCVEMVSKIVLSPEASGVFNLRGPEGFSIHDLVSHIEKTCGPTFESRFDPVAPYENIGEIEDTRIRLFVEPSYRHSVPTFLDKMVGG